MNSTAVHDLSFAAVIVAAGSGARFGRAKHDVTLGGTPLWQRCVETMAEAGIDDVIVVGNVPGGIPGGLRRQDSVLAGLEAFDTAPEWVLIHDAARPLLSVSLVRSILSATREGVDGVIPVLAVTDTIKRIDDDRVITTIDRDDLVAVQTPQAFRFEALIAAHRSAPELDVTDDAALVERAGGTVVVIEGERSNMKVTYPGDLAIAESILEKGQR